MTFKQNWETSDTQHLPPNDSVKKMLYLAYSNKRLKSSYLISGGCANLNYQICLDDHKQPLLLRIYLRDKNSAYKEQKISEVLKASVPVPTFYYIGDLEEYRFAVTEFMPGITLRELLLSDRAHDLSNIMYRVGVLLGTISSFDFPGECIQESTYVDYAKRCLRHPTVLAQLDSHFISNINAHLEHYKNYFPGNEEKHLVHADFDPANILVDKINNDWQITAVLDWEFSFAGSVLCDMANMLRYAHQMPSAFEHSFLEGLNDSGIYLPEHWRISVHLLNLLSLFDCLQRSSPEHRPNQCADICSLIACISEQLDKNKQGK